MIDYVAELQKRGVRCSGQNVEIEEDLLMLFPPVENSVCLYEPCIITDCEGRILVWYLPGLIGPNRGVGIHIFKSIC